MIITTNITNTSYDMERFTDGDDIQVFCRKHRLHGLELLPYGENTLGTVPADLVVGVHLSYYNCWVDFWNGNESGVLAEFGSRDAAEGILGTDKEELIRRYRAQLVFAESVGAEYVVFHVSDVSMSEAVSYVFTHTDTQVIDAALELMNAILEGGRYSFRFLVENLWWPGFTMTKPHMTRRLLDGIRYDKKGIMLDLGHLLHTNIGLTTQEDGVAYIHQMLDAHGSLCAHIKGVHLQQSLSGSYVKALIANPPQLAGSYGDRLGQIYPHIYEIDAHRPFTSASVKTLIDRISPDFLTYEFSTRSREEHEVFLSRQNTALGLTIL
jgi:hypothetical protein